MKICACRALLIIFNYDFMRLSVNISAIFTLTASAVMAQNAVPSDTLAATPAITADSVATVEVPVPEGGVGVP